MTAAPPLISVTFDGSVACVSGQHEYGQPTGDPWWRWDGATLRVGAGNTAAPFLYLHTRPDGVTVSPSLAAIAGRERLTFDRVAWTTNQFLGYYIGEDTPFANVRALAPDATAVFDESGLKRGSPAPAYDREAISRPAAIARFRELMDRSVRRAAASHADATVYVELSAGLDSRHVLGQLLHSGVTVAQCVTSFKYPPDDMDETALASRVSRTVGVPWVQVAPPRERARAEMSAAVVQGLCTDGGAWWLYRTHPAFSASPTVWYSGTGGDAVAGRVPGPAWLQVPGQGTPTRAIFDAHLDRGDFEGTARMMLARSRRGRLLLPLLASRFDIAPAPADAVVARIATELETHARAGDTLAAFLVLNGVRRKLIPAVTGLLKPGDSARMPFMDPEVVRFLLSLGPRRQYADFHLESVAGYQWRNVPTPSDPHSDRFAGRQRAALAALAHVAGYYRDLTRRIRPLGDPRFHFVADARALGAPRLLAALLTNTLQWLLIRRWLDGPAASDSRAQSGMAVAMRVPTPGRI